jgi:regulation of enolase protein 1 (concanavalin A-like superfamily)
MLVSLVRAYAGRVRIARVVPSCVLVALFLSPVFVPTAAAQTALPNGWQTIAVGSSALPGYATDWGWSQCSDAPCDSFFVVSGGRDIGGQADQFRFVYRTLAGDGTVIVRAESLTSSNANAKAGVMLRESLSSGSRNAFVGVTAGSGAVFQRRKVTNDVTVSTVRAGAVPRWLRIDRRGTTVSGYQSADGVTWTLVGSDTVAMASSMYVGIALTSHDATATASAIATQAAIRPLLPAPWAADDVGAPSLPGTTAYASGAYFVQAAGTDIWGTADQFRFTYQRVSGDVDIIAKVSSLTNVDDWAKAGVMIRASMAADAAHASMFMSAARGPAFQYRLTAGDTSWSTSGGTGAAPGWVRLERRGDVITAFHSTDGSLWRVIDSQVVTLPSTIYVGLAATSHTSAAYTDARFDAVSVRSLAGNASPTVSLTSPSAGATFATGTTVTVAASAADSDGTIAAVDFYAGTVLIGRDAIAPYSVTWSSATAGSYTLKAVARDNAGATTTSATRTISIGSFVPEASASPAAAQFTASPDHDTAVSYYYLEIFAATADLRTASAYAVKNLGKPVPVSGICTADVSATIASLPAGSYVAVVSAVGAGGISSSAPSPAFTK